MSYITSYVCFVNTLKSQVDSDNNWYKYYLTVEQINKKAINTLKNKNLMLNSFFYKYQFATLQYIVLKVLKRYFG